MLIVLDAGADANLSRRPLRNVCSGDVVEVALLHTNDELLPFGRGVRISSPPGISGIAEND